MILGQGLCFLGRAVTLSEGLWSLCGGLWSLGGSLPPWPPSPAAPKGLRGRCHSLRASARLLFLLRSRCLQLGRFPN